MDILDSRMLGGQSNLGGYWTLFILIGSSERRLLKGGRRGLLTQYCSQLLVSAGGLLLAGKYFEHTWGSRYGNLEKIFQPPIELYPRSSTARELVKYVLIVSVVSYICVFFAIVCEYAITMDSTWL